MVITSSPVLRLKSTIDCVREHLDGAGSDWGIQDYRKLLHTLKNHIQTLCFRVNCLESKNNMHTEITKDHGKVLIQDDGGVVMEAEVFNRIISSLNIDKGICHNFIVNFKTQGVSCRCRYRTFRGGFKVHILLY